MKTALVCKKHVYNVRFVIDKHTQLYYCPKCRKNQNARARNTVLRELTGTSAAAAKRDMGL